VLLAGAAVAVVSQVGKSEKQPAAKAPASDPHGDGTGAKIVPGPSKPADPLPATYTNALGIEFVKVPRGAGWLGGGAGKPGEQRVEFDYDFYLGKYEVTQDEWRAVMGNNPSSFSRAGMKQDAVKDVPDADLRRHPVESVSWDEATRFVALLNEKLKDGGGRYSLPKSTEWEYACRGGPVSDRAESTFDYYLAKPSNEYATLREQANYNGLNRTRRVGCYAPNRLGLHDMHGNVWEWCSDDGPPGANGTPQRIYRGGGAHGLEGRCRALSYVVIGANERDYDVGLRLVWVPSVRK
jgi:eukaryotic-like serine/threonine-protein kinase